MDQIGEKLTDFDELSWAAGIFEGEGSIYYIKSSDQWAISLDMTDLDVVEHFASIWDMNVNKRSDQNNFPSTIAQKKVSGTSSDRKQMYRAKTQARDKVYTIVCDIYPYLGARRREKCDEFLIWYANKTGQRYD